MNQLTITTPDDFHTHFRDDVMLHETVPATARVFNRAIVMPNLVPPLTTATMTKAYRERILQARPLNSTFTPLMTLYLTDKTTREDILEAKEAGVVAVKLYPAGATTNSHAGVQNLEKLYPVLESVAEQKMILLIHGEVTDSDVDIFDRERVFIERHLSKILNAIPGLKIVLEHITTTEAVEFVKNAGCNLAATITPQHLLLNRNDLLVGGIRPHNFCLPVLKRRKHQESLHAVIASGNPHFFLGTDSAPHDKTKKESSCGCAGCYSAHWAIELYAHIFEELDILPMFNGFASHYGADFYGLTRNTGTITLLREPWQIPQELRLSDGGTIVPFFAGETVNWRIATR